MTALEDLPYSIAAHDIIAETDGMRVQIMTLGAGEAVPWHYHTKVTDVFVGLEGTVVIETRAPRACYELEPGDHCVVLPMTAHTVSGKDGRSCRVTLVQGVGEHDFTASGRQGCGTGVSLAGIIRGVAPRGGARDRGCHDSHTRSLPLFQHHHPPGLRLAERDSSCRLCRRQHRAIQLRRGQGRGHRAAGPGEQPQRLLVARLRQSGRHLAPARAVRRLRHSRSKPR